MITTFKRISYRLIVIAALCSTYSSVVAGSLKIITDIAPVQALVDGVSGSSQVSEPLIAPNVSMHDFALKPSDIKVLREADLVIWLGPKATPALAKLLSGNDFIQKSMILNDVSDTTLLASRKPGVLAQESGNSAHQDPHTWLDPDNGLIWANAIKDRFIQVNPENSDQYSRNFVNLKLEIEALKTRGNRLFAETPSVFVQFHDGFQYFEKAFGLAPVGTAVGSDDEPSRLGTLTDIRKALGKAEDSCLFVSGKAQQKRAAPILEIDGVRLGYLDAFGVVSTESKPTYPILLNSLIDDFAECLYPD